MIGQNSSFAAFTACSTVAPLKAATKSENIRVLMVAPIVWSRVNFMAVFGRESFGSRSESVFSSRSSSFSLLVEAAEMAAVEGTR